MIRTLVIGLVLVLSGSFLASRIQTGNGDIKVQDVRFVGSAGQLMSGLLYVPNNASEASPQPAVLAIHGYINSRETQSGFAIELSRRGFVVLALDQTGHGYSDPPAFSYGFGGPDGLRYLSSLAFVDKDRIGLEGHSMGGWASLMAASQLPEAYAAMVLEGSSTGTFGTAEGTTSFPKNLLLVFSRFDEFSELMWDARTSPEIVNGQKLKKLFGTDRDVEIGRIYGDIENGTARKLAMPGVTHPGDHLSRQAIGAATDWLQTTLKPETPRPSSDQVWYWKELGTLLALTGLFLLIIPLANILLTANIFSSLCTVVPKFAGIEGKLWFLTAGTSAIIPILTFFSFQNLGTATFPADIIWSQSVTNGIVAWMLGTGAINLMLFGLWLKFGQRTITHHRQWGMGDIHELWRSLLFAISLVGAIYLVVASIHFFFLTDFRFWVVALKLMSKVQFFQFLAYAPFVCLFFVFLATGLHTQLRIRGLSTAGSMAVNALILTIGFVLLLGIQYIPLLSGNTLTVAEPLLTIIAFQFVPLMVIIACISTWCFDRTGSVYPGSFVNGLIITWYLVAGQATQAVPFLAG